MVGDSRVVGALMSGMSVAFQVNNVYPSCNAVD